MECSVGIILKEPCHKTAYVTYSTDLIPQTLNVFVIIIVQKCCKSIIIYLEIVAQIHCNV
ncbi:hypothetical protein PR048_006458 [Dryococelus australis]|uniref:Uncharacterized protein n=1 Tax=Dryococelus australis TaxID=614101 RepID=A0ABQ9IBP4_9NEOP|nr:hypothetical protein PR048_006458 [Dryococelus australis]